MLSRKWKLFDVEDVEAFCRAVMREHLAVGVKTNAGYSGHSRLTPHQQDDLLAYLIETCWRLSQKYHGKDDGRGKLRFSGYALPILHKRCVDWKRMEFGSTRAGFRASIELTDDERLYVADLVDLTGPEILDLVNSVEIGEYHRETLKRIVLPAVREQRTVEEYAKYSGIPRSELDRRIGALRREFERKPHLLSA